MGVAEEGENCLILRAEQLAGVDFRVFCRWSRGSR